MEEVGSLSCSAIPLDHVVFELGLDETHMEASAPGNLAEDLTGNRVTGYFPFLVMRGSLDWQQAGLEARNEPLVVPLAVLGARADAEGLWAALNANLPIHWKRFLGKGKFVGLTLSKDDHRVNRRLLRAIIKDAKRLLFVLSKECIMHQAQIVHKDIYCLSFLQLQNPLYCIANLLQFGRHTYLLRKFLHDLIRLRFRRSWLPPKKEHCEYVDNLLTKCFLDATPGADPQSESSSDDSTPELFTEGACSHLPCYCTGGGGEAHCIIIGYRRRTYAQGGASSIESCVKHL